MMGMICMTYIILVFTYLLFVLFIGRIGRMDSI